MTIKDSALADSDVGFVLATNMTLPENQEKLTAIKTLDMESMSF